MMPRVCSFRCRWTDRTSTVGNRASMSSGVPRHSRPCSAASWSEMLRMSTAARRMPNARASAANAMRARAEADQAQEFAVQFIRQRRVHHALVQVGLGLAVTMGQHQREQQRPLGKRRRAGRSRAVGNRDAPRPPVLEVEVLVTRTHDLPQAHPCAASSIARVPTDPPESMTTSAFCNCASSGAVRSKITRSWRAPMASTTCRGSRCGSGR